MKLLEKPIEKFLGGEVQTEIPSETDQFLGIRVGTPCWPGEIENSIKRHIGGNTIDIDLQEGVEDITCDSKELLKTFAPDVRLLGYELRLELQSKSWGGVLVRALRNESDSRRCLQYIYVYLRQQSVISFVWMIMVPILLGMWGLFIMMIFMDESIQVANLLITLNFNELFTLGSHWLPILSTGLVAFPLFLTGLWPHVMDIIKNPRGSKLCRRSTTLLMLYATLMWFAPLNIYIPIGIMLSGVAFLAIWVLGSRDLVPGSHPMDYTPVFVWLKLKKRPVKLADKGNPDNWEVDSVAWDNYHYHSIILRYEELFREYRFPPRYGPVFHKADYLTDNRRVRLLMANQWHSLFLGAQEHAAIFDKIEWVSATALLVLLITFASYFLGALPNLELFVFVINPLVFISLARTAARKPTELVSNSDDFVALSSHLCDRKLVALWNLLDERARLVIITKMQYPFPHYDTIREFFSSFRDDIRDLYTIISNFKYGRQHPFRIAAFDGYYKSSYQPIPRNRPKPKVCCHPVETIDHFCNVMRLYRKRHQCYTK